MKQRDVKRVGFLVVSTDRGLCGGLNINLFKRTVKSMKEWADQGVEIELSLIGAKAAAFFNSYGGNVTAAVRDLGETPALADLIGAVKTMLDRLRGRAYRSLVPGEQSVRQHHDTESDLWSSCCHWRQKIASR